MKGKLLTAYVVVQNALYNFKHKERGAVDIVAIVVMIGIAIGVALLFKDQIATLIGNIFSNFDTDGFDEKATP